MTKWQAAQLARELMNQHGLDNWTFRWNRRKRAAGVCKCGKRVIELSEYYVKLNGEEDIRDTILHEIAHALAPSDAGHDWRWRQICRRIGAKPVRCFDTSEVVMPKGRYVAVCGTCNREFRRHRMTARANRLFCEKCYITGNRERGKLNWKEAY